MFKKSIGELYKIMNLKNYLLNESITADRAHKLGYTSAGGAYWQDKTGKIRAMTKGGKLVNVKFNTKEEEEKVKAAYKGKPKKDADDIDLSTGYSNDPEIAKEEKKKQKEKERTFKAGKNKKIDASVVPKKQEYFNKPNVPLLKKDKDFYKSIKKYGSEDKDLSLKSQFTMPTYIFSDNKMPQREAQYLERMINCKKGNKDGTKPPRSFFTDDHPGGAGKIPAQAGELLCLAFVTCETKEKAESLKKSILEHLRKNGEDKNDMIITSSWLDAAWKQNEAILKHISDEFNIKDPRSMVEAGCWDTKDGVTSLGFDYSQKGKSTDIFIRIKDKKGNIMLEVSLKKDKNIFFLNSGTGKFKKWYGKENKLPEEIDQELYGKKETVHLAKTKSIMEKTPAKLSALQGIIRQNEKSDKDKIAELLDKIGKPENLKNYINPSIKEPKRDKRDIQHVLAICTQLLADHGDGQAKKIWNDITNVSNTFAKDSISAICTNKKLRNGMLEDLAKEFPIKACSENEEIMTIGGILVNKKVVATVFGTSDWNIIKEDLVAVTTADPPYMAYKIKGKKPAEYIPIANISIREDGIGYGGTFKFELKMNNDFFKKLNSANMELYGNNLPDEYNPFRKFLYLDIITEDDNDE